MVLDISTEFGATPNIVHLLYFLPQRHFFKNPFWIVVLGYFFMRLPCPMKVLLLTAKIYDGRIYECVF